MKRFDKLKLGYFILSLFFILLLLFLSYSRVFDEFEYSMLDFRYRLRPPQPIDKNIVIVEIGDDSIEKLGEWPFPRHYHALLVEALKAGGAKTIIFDMFFSEEKEDDKIFADAIKKAGNIYIAYVFAIDKSNPDKTHLYAEKYAAPLIKTLEEVSKGTGFVNVELDKDGKMRKVSPFIEYQGKFYPHLTIVAVLGDLGARFDKVKIIPAKEIIVNSNIKIPLDEDSSLLVNYPARWEKAFRHYSYVDILQSYLAGKTSERPILNLTEFKDAVCFIGFTAAASPDAHPSPMESQYPGSGVHASVYNSIIKKQFLQRLNKWWNLFVLILICLVTAYITAKSRKRFAFLSILLIMIGYCVISMVLFWPFGVWIDVFYPLLAAAIIYVIFTFKKYVTEIQRREIIEKELDIAKNIQLSLLPKTLPKFEGIDISARMITARQVGGDLYDIIKLDDKRLGVIIGDVSGKGVPAALYMARVVSVCKNFDKEKKPNEVLESINNKLLYEDTSNLFATLTYMIFDIEGKSVSYAIGGHLPTLLIEPNGEVQFLDVEEGLPLGMVESNFTLGERPYKPRSTFILYTDGVTEAKNTKGGMFGQKRLIELSRTLRDYSAERIVNSIHRNVSDFAARAKQHDDITVIAVRIE